MGIYVSVYLCTYVVCLCVSMCVCICVCMYTCMLLFWWESESDGKGPWMTTSFHMFSEIPVDTSSGNETSSELLLRSVGLLASPFDSRRCWWYWLYNYQGEVSCLFSCLCLLLLLAHSLCLRTYSVFIKKAKALVSWLSTVLIGSTGEEEVSWHHWEALMTQQ